MFNPQQQNNGGAGRSSAMSQAISMMGTLGGIAGAVLLTPIIYGISKPTVFEFLSGAWGPDLAPALTWTIGACECIAIFVTIKLVIVSLATWGLMSLTRRFV